MTTKATSHTPEPWEADGNVILQKGDNASEPIALLVSEPGYRPVVKAQHNAARIITCVNACAGIADPSAIPELIGAATKLLEAGMSGKHNEDLQEILEAREQLRASIAATEKELKT